MNSEPRYPAGSSRVKRISLSYYIPTPLLLPTEQRDRSTHVKTSPPPFPSIFIHLFFLFLFFFLSPFFPSPTHTEILNEFRRGSLRKSFILLSSLSLFLFFEGNELFLFFEKEEREREGISKLDFIRGVKSNVHRCVVLRLGEIKNSLCFGTKNVEKRRERLFLFSPP